MIGQFSRSGSSKVQPQPNGGKPYGFLHFHGERSVAKLDYREQMDAWRGVVTLAARNDCIDGRIGVIYNSGCD
ncbi:MAG TPA: hypothetical protein VH107_10705 [Lacipirellulaceae bacterium]|jgi:hypothetical protein|nr:hypothetical protein [Lacipirellulaceae bacterium]